jgi:hypothetical protein
MRFFSLLIFTFSVCIGSAQISISECNVFESGPNDSWPFVLTAVTPEDADSGAAQSFQINVNELPADGANYRVAKTVSNGNWYFGPATPLSVGLNVINVTATDFDRTVKFQFSTGDVLFDALVLNDNDINSCVESSEGMAIANCPVFDEGPNDTWPHVLMAVTADDVDSGELQTLDITVTSLPEAGGEYRIAKTVANGNWFFGNPIALALGLNAITVEAVDFQRTVKFQFSDGTIEITSLVLNGEELFCESTPCVDVDNNGICDDNEVDPSFYCGTGTVWSSEEEKCVAQAQCVGDLDYDGLVASPDLLTFLSVFGSYCE